MIFEDGTDLYWARSRVLEYLSAIAPSLPATVTPALGPDATGVGWAFMYTLSSTNRDLAELRSLQDWSLRYQLGAVPGAAEVASIGGFVRQYQVTVDPTRLRAFNLSIADVRTAVERSNGEVGGRSLELAEKEFVLRVRGYVHSLDDLRQVAVTAGPGGVPVRLGDVATVQYGPDMRRGVAELNGEGETVGGIVVVRAGANARQVVRDVKQRLAQVQRSLPPDVHVAVAYDRSALIDRAVRTLRDKLVEESLVVALVCAAFLLHLPSALVAILILPLAVLMGLFIRGRILPEARNPINRLLVRLYHPAVEWVLNHRRAVVAAAAVIVLWVFFPWNGVVTRHLPAGPWREAAQTMGRAFPFQNIGSEFMPPLAEGDLLYMPTTWPGISPAKARELLQQTDKIIRSFPEVENVFGKAGRAETATDPAPFDMLETTIMLKDEAAWSPRPSWNCSSIRPSSRCGRGGS